MRHRGKKNVLIVHNGGAVASHGLLFDHADELEGAAEGSVQVGPLGALEVPHLQNVVVLPPRTKRVGASSQRESNTLVRD